MNIILIIILCLFILSFLAFRIGDIFSPWMLTCCVWLGILVLLILFSDMLYPLGTRFYTCVAIWVPILTTTGILTYYALPSNESDTIRPIGQLINLNKSIFYPIMVFSVVISPFYVYKTVQLAMMFSTEDFIANLRIATLGGESASSSIMKYINAINLSMYIVAIWRFPQIKKWVFFVIVAANVLCAFATMAKFPIFALLFMTLFVLYEKRKIKLRTIGIWGLAIVLIFYGINQLRTLSSATEDTTFLEFFSIYVISPAVAFERTQEKLTEQFGSYTFSFEYAVISKLGLAKVYVVKQLQEFVEVPVQTNVYTVFQPYYEDFGYKGIAFFAVVWGTFTGWLYRLCRNGGDLPRCIYSYIVVVLIMQFFQESLIINTSVIIQYTILCWLFTQRDLGICRKMGHTQ